ncbi:MAG: hypothetical protein ABEJ03_06265 [Candidatus Nanohaloarchaea archaeon]
MPNKEDTEKALEILEEDIERLGYDIEEEIDEEIEGQEVRGFHCRREQFAFQVLTVIDENIPFFEVRYVFNAQQIIARELKRRNEAGEDEEIEFDPEEDEDYIEEARKKLVGLTRREFRKIQKGLIERITSTDTFYKIATIDNYGIEAFQVQKRVFPLEDFYNISKLESAVRAVINKGDLGGIFLAHSYELEDFFDEEFDGKEDKEESELGYIG